MSLSVSIVTPSFNQGKYIERTIQSVLSQNIPLEYVVVDGGSTDETLAILKRYEKSLRFISEADRGQAHAVNKGIMMTSGYIIGWLNSDDTYYLNAVQTARDFLLAHPAVDIVYGKANHIDEKDQIIEPYPTEEWSFQRLKQTCFISQPAVFFRRRVIEKVGLLNEKLNFCLDYEYWVRLAQGGRGFAYLPVVLAGSRLYPATKTMSSPVAAQQETLHMLHDRLGYVPENWLLNEAITTVKNKTQLKRPHKRYPFAIFCTALAAACRWNGVWKGLQSSFKLPAAMQKRRKKPAQK